MTGVESLEDKELTVLVRGKNLRMFGLLQLFTGCGSLYTLLDYEYTTGISSHGLRSPSEKYFLTISLN